MDTCGGGIPDALQLPISITTYEWGQEVSSPPTRKNPASSILGGGPNRIGQGIEFDYCCCHASFALKDAGVQAIMVNSNPETVSTDYDTSDRLYFEPLTFEDVMHIVEKERPDGVIVQFGGQTPLNLAVPLLRAGVPILGTQPGRPGPRRGPRASSARCSTKLSTSPSPPTARRRRWRNPREVAHRIGYPAADRARATCWAAAAMVIAYDERHLKSYMEAATRVSKDHPIYLDSFLDSAVELDVDALADGEQCYVGSVLEQIEEAGIHSGDSACCMPPYSLADSMIAEIRETTHKLALACHVVGALNVQYAVHNGRLYVIELNPRASRTVPFSSKSTGVPLARMAAKIMAGEKICDLGLPPEDRTFDYFACKEAVLPFDRFPGADMTLGPEMKSTGEVMGVAPTFPAAYAKTQLAISYGLPTKGRVFISVRDRDKRAIVGVARDLVGMGFELVGTTGTAKALRAAGIDCKSVRRASEMRPNIATMLSGGDIQLIINTPGGHDTRGDFYTLRQLAVRYRVTNVTTLAGAQAMTEAIRTARAGSLDVVALQDL